MVRRVSSQFNWRRDARLGPAVHPAQINWILIDAHAIDKSQIFLAL